jgi:hypothetical protein
MEEEIVFYINSQPKEIREKLIEYLKVWNSKDIDEFASRRKKMGSKQFQAQKLSLGEFMTSLLPLEDILKKLENDSQSQSKSHINFQSKVSLHCEICDIRYYGQKQMLTHLQTNKHKKKLAMSSSVS